MEYKYESWVHVGWVLRSSILSAQYNKLASTWINKVLIFISHPDDLCRMSSAWLMMLHYVIQIKQLISFLSHPNDLAIPSISFPVSHPDDLWPVLYAIRMTYFSILCHPDDLLNWGWYLTRMSYGIVIMSSGSDTLPFLSHPDEIAIFDFPQHAVALQRFCASSPRLTKLIRMPLYSMMPLIMSNFMQM